MAPLVEEHISYLKAMGQNPSSGRKGCLRGFAKAWDAEGQWVSSLYSGFVTDWFIYRDQPLQPSSRRTYASWIRSFITWGETKGHWSAEPLRFNPGKTSSRRSKQPTWFSAEFFRNAWESESWYWRGLLAFAALSLARGSEIITLKVGDIDFDAGRVGIIRHKTDDKDDRLPMYAELIDEMRRYLSAYAASINQPLRADMYLFPRYRSHTHADRSTVYPYQQRDVLYVTLKRLIVKYMNPTDAANPEKTHGLGGHAVRRSMARAIYEMEARENENYDAIRVVQGMLGHTDVTNTQLYIGLSSVREARDRAIAGKRFFKQTAQVIPFPTAKEA